ncbi:MAG: hypothetical protein QOF40_1462 [Actinomycetota bacterium]|nr:hypothetical protein [Actinomycetota bacterium]
MASAAGRDERRAARSSIASVQVSPTAVDAGSWTPLTFTFNVGADGTRDGAIELSVPKGWALPEVSPSSAGHVAASGGILTVDGPTIRVHGLNRASDSRLVVRYGGGPTAATAPAAPGSYRFTSSAARTSSAPLAPLDRSPAVRVRDPNYSCRKTTDPNGAGRPLSLPNGMAQPNFHNVQLTNGSIEQCLTASGITTDLALTTVAPRGYGPAAYPEVAYGYNLFGEPFCRTCHSEPFPLRVADLGGPDSDYRLTTKYSLGAPSPSTLPHDFVIDLWLEQDPTAGAGPRPGDVELIIFLYEHQIASCDGSPVPSATFSTAVLLRGRPTAATWRVCEIRGGTDATPLAFFLDDPAPTRQGDISLRLADFVQRGAEYLARDLNGHSLMGVEVGSEVDLCTPQGCASPNPTWKWRISQLALENGVAAIPIVSSKSPAR